MDERRAIDLFFTRHPVTVVDSAKRKLLRAFRRRQSSSPASLLFLDPRGLRFFLLCFQVTAVPFISGSPDLEARSPWNISYYIITMV